MLKLKYLFENYDLARKCLAFYEYDEESLDDSRFSTIISEIPLINWLNEQDFPAMRPVAMKSGEFAKEISTE